jgi:hypothetical protein
MDGSLNQSPVLYIALLLGVFIIGFLMLTLTKRSDSGAKFNFWLFVCVALSGVLIGGVIHEFAHVILIQHPTQFRVHFGDSSTIFSTCCLGPGEYAYEEIAYAIQFVVSLGWILAFKNNFYAGKKTPGKKKGKRMRKEKSDGNEKQDENVESGRDHVDVEWEKAKKSMEGLLGEKNGKATRRKNPSKKENDFTMTRGSLNRLKVPPRE